MTLSREGRGRRRPRSADRALRAERDRLEKRWRGGPITPIGPTNATEFFVELGPVAAEQLPHARDRAYEPRTGADADTLLLLSPPRPRWNPLRPRPAPSIEIASSFAGQAPFLTWRPGSPQACRRTSHRCTSSSLHSALAARALRTTHFVRGRSHKSRQSASRSRSNASSRPEAGRPRGRNRRIWRRSFDPLPRSRADDVAFHGGGR